MRRSLLLLPAALLAVAALLVWHLWPKHQPAPDDALAGLPHVASVEGNANGRAERTVIHLLDWHLVPRELFDKDVEAEAGRRLDRDELDRLYAEHLDAVEKVQAQVGDILRHLAAMHPGLPVYVEGLTDGGAKVFGLKATALSDVGKTQIAEARKSFAEVRAMKGPKAADLAKQYEALIANHRAETLELGAAAGPCVEGLVEVRALEDEGALEKAGPRWMAGKFLPDPEAHRAREEEMARRLAQAKEPVVVVLLGGAHDLGDRLRNHAPQARYVRVTAHAYREASGGK